MSQKSVAFDRAAEYYDETRGFPAGVDIPATALFVEAGNLTRDSHVLEVGVGTGRIALPLSRHVGAIYGVDLSRPMLERLNAKRQDEPVYPVQGDATRLPFPNGVFDAAVAVHFFHLVPGWRDVLRELARVLRPDGILMHGWNDRAREDQMDQVWRTITDKNPARRPGVAWAEQRTFLPDNGWQPVGDERVYAYTVERSPQEYIDQLKRRLWSHTWSMPDDELAAGIAAVQTYVDATYDDPHKPVAVESSFHVQAYKRSEQFTVDSSQ